MFKRSLLLSSVAFSTALCGAHIAHASIIKSKTGATMTHIVSVKNSALEDQAVSFISSLAEDGIGFLTDESISKEQQKSEFEKLLIRNFDMKTIGRFALGRYWRSANKAQQSEYLELFQDMIVHVYSRRFSDYDGQALNVLSARPEGKKDVMVASEIVPDNGAKISVNWRVRQKKDGSLKVIDIIVEGVSMSLTQRSDFASVIQRGGGNVEVLLKHLRKNAGK